MYARNVPKSQSFRSSSTDYCSVLQDTRRQASTSANGILQLWKVKASSVDCLVTWSRRVTFRWTIQKPIPFLSCPIVAILHELLDIVRTHPKAATLRLSCILVAKDDKKMGNFVNDGLDVLLSLIWWRAINAINESEVETFAQFYCELIIVCSRYDCQECLIKSMTPLLATLNDNVESLLHNSASKTGISNYDIHAIHRKIFALILSRRGNILKELLPPQAFRNCTKPFLSDLITKASILFDRPSDWIDNAYCNRSRMSIMKGLQLCGILGLDAVANTTYTKKKKYKMPKKALPWIGDESSTCLLESSFQNLIPWLSEEWKEIPIFSTCIGRNFVQSDSNHSEVSSALRAANMNLLQEDLIVNVFSFLSYKRLVRMRLVCTEWKKLSDKPNLWYNIYRKRYKFMRNDTLKNEDLTLNWKKLFVDRHQAERRIRFQNSKKYPKWKLRLCTHLNCLVLLKSPEFAQKHSRTHMKKAIVK
jgi:F-box domain